MKANFQINITNRSENEIDSLDESHSWRGKVECPKCQLPEQLITHCKDVNATWIVCDNCGLVDV